MNTPQNKNDLDKSKQNKFSDLKRKEKIKAIFELKENKKIKDFLNAIEN